MIEVHSVAIRVFLVKQLLAEVEVVEKRRAEVKVGKPVKLVLSRRLVGAKNVLALGEVALLCGHALVATSNPDLLKWRQWAVKFSFAFPIFTLVVLIFAVVVAKNEGLTEADILKHCDGKLARFKQPKGVAFIDEIPRNPTGKPLKRLLRELFPGPAPE